MMEWVMRLAGIVFALSGISLIINGYVSGIPLIAAAIFLFPETERVIERQTKMAICLRFRTAIVLVLFLLHTLLFPYGGFISQNGGVPISSSHTPGPDDAMTERGISGTGLSIGKTARVNDMDISVLSVTEAKNYTYVIPFSGRSSEMKAAAGMNFFIARVSASNKGALPAGAYPSRFSLTDNEGASYTPGIAAGEAETELERTLYGGESSKGDIVFTVPEGRIPIYVTYNLSSPRTASFVWKMG